MKVPFLNMPYCRIPGEQRKSLSKSSWKALARIRLVTKRLNSAENKPPPTVFFVSRLTHVTSTISAAPSLVRV